MNAVDHGPKLSGEEYDRRIVELYEDLPATPSRKQMMDVKRNELEIMIDHRLGTLFPRERREKLWAAQRKIDRRRLRLFAAYLFRHLFKKNFLKEKNWIAQCVVDEYAKVLNQSELEMFFGKREVKNPSLPINEQQ
jgi:hypothetical protein